MTLPVTFRLFGIPFHYVTPNDRSAVFEDILNTPGLHPIFTPNPEILLVALKHDWYRGVLQQAYWNMPDGNGILWATAFLDKTKNTSSKLKIIAAFLSTYSSLVFSKKSLRKVFPEVITGQDSFFQMHEVFEARGTRVFYFGSEGDVPEKIGPEMRRRYPKCNVVGAIGGYPFRSKEENESILKIIEDAQPEVIFVALPFPKQERWILENKDRWEKAGVRMALGCGGTLDVAVGKIKRSPTWMKKLQIEWMWRLYQEPGRFRRIFEAVFLFPWKVLQRKLAGTEDFE